MRGKEMLEKDYLFEFMTRHDYAKYMLDNYKIMP